MTTFLSGEPWAWQYNITGESSYLGRDPRGRPKWLKGGSGHHDCPHRNHQEFVMTLSPEHTWSTGNVPWHSQQGRHKCSSDVTSSKDSGVLGDSAPSVTESLSPVTSTSLPSVASCSGSQLHLLWGHPSSSHRSHGVDAQPSLRLPVTRLARSGPASRPLPDPTQ